MELKEIFKPSKKKIAGAIIFSLFLVILYFTIPQFGYQALFAKMSIPVKCFNFIVSWVANAIIYYPLICCVGYIYKLVKKKEEINKRSFIVSAIIILILNPITLVYLYYAVMGAMYVPCGMNVVGYSGEFSPAKEAGLGLWETIVAINKNKTDTSKALIYEIAKTKPGDVVAISTNIKDYNVTVKENPNNPDTPYIGVLVKEKYCTK